MNTKWHKEHVMPKGASTAQRIAWHRAHQRQCACRPIPATLQKEMVRASAGRQGDPAVDAYLTKVNPTQRRLLQKLRKDVHAVIPQAEECISYGLPAFRLDGKVVAGFGATSKGCSYYPFSGTTLATLADELEGFSQTKSALHFGPDQPLSPPLIRRLLKARLEETKARARA